MKRGLSLLLAGVLLLSGNSCIKRRIEYEIRDGQTIAFVRIPAKDGVPAFYMQETETTIGQVTAYDVETGDGPNYKAINSGREVDPMQPANYMSINDMKDFCKWLSKKIKEPVSLPTLTQWQRVAFNDQKPGQTEQEYVSTREGNIGREINIWQRFLGSQYTISTRNSKRDSIGLYNLWGNLNEVVYDKKNNAYYSVGKSFGSKADDTTYSDCMSFYLDRDFPIMGFRTVIPCK